jgi:glucose/arabinose dehydrogenase
MIKFYFLVITLLTTLQAATQAPVIEYQSIIATGLADPVDVVNPGDGTNRLFLVQRGGLIRIWNGSEVLPNPFLNVTSLLSLSGGERGLLSIVFHPNYASNRYFFIYYTSTTGALTLARYRTLADNANLADAASGVVLLSIPHTAGNHNGAKLIFGTDGFLYFGTGDGGGSNDVPNNAQNGNSLLGKMLRIDVNDFADATPPLYGIPAGNPYTGDAAVLDEIIALGVRNPWRWSFDRVTGDMWIGDVGQGAREEVDFRHRDSILNPTNYGWRCLEGFITNPSMAAACPAPVNNVLPVFDYPHNANGGFVITGGYVYRGAEFPSLNGYYITTDYSTGNIWLIAPDGDEWEVTPQIINKLTNVSSFGEAENGDLYATRLNNGTPNTGGLYKVILGQTLPVKLLSFTARAVGNTHEISWKTSAGQKGDTYVVERKKTGEPGFTEVGQKKVTGTSQQEYTLNIPTVPADCWYRLKTVGTDGAVNYSAVIFLPNKKTAKEIFTINRSGSLVTLMLHEPVQSVEVFNASGAQLYKQLLNDRSGMITLPLVHSNGLVFVRATTATGSETKKLVW